MLLKACRKNAHISVVIRTLTFYKLSTIVSTLKKNVLSVLHVNIRSLILNYLPIENTFFSNFDKLPDVIYVSETKLNDS